MGSRAKIIWRVEWRRPYESIWSLIEKIKIANRVNGNDLLKSIQPGYGVIDRKRNVNKLSTEAHERLQALTDVDFNAIIRSMEKLFKINFLRDPMHIYHTHLRYCKTCIQHNYHSYLHQYKLIDNCPFHLEEYEAACPKCEKQIFFHNIAIPYKTCSCGMQLYHSSGLPVWDNWPEINPVIKDKYVKDILRFTLDELVLTLDDVTLIQSH